MRILVATPYLPHRGVGHGGGTAVRDLVRNLARLHEVHVFALLRPGEDRLIAEVESLGVRVVPVPFLDRGAEGPAALRMGARRAAAWARTVRSGFPQYVEKYAEAGILRAFTDAVEAIAPDAIQIEYLQLSLLARDLVERGAAKRPRIIINSHELGSVPRERRADRAGSPLGAAWLRREASAWRRLQVAACDWCDQMLCVTPEDLEIFAAMGGKNLTHMPLGMDLDRLQLDWKPEAGNQLLFVGSFEHRPNHLAADFLLEQWESLTAAVPDVRLRIVGRGSVEHLDAHGGATIWRERGVEALGFVDDLTPLFRRSRLFVAPLAEGGGIKIKILEAMARGLPVLTTAIGAEGIADESSRTIYLTTCDGSFAEAVATALGDAQATQRSRRGRELVEQEFSWRGIVERLTRLYGSAR